MNKKGVTLIELIIVFVIIAIGAVLIAPNIGAWLPRYRLRSATRDIASTMRTAQMKAVSTNMEYRVSFNNPVAGSYVLQRNSGTPTNPVWVNEGAVETLPRGVQINVSGGDDKQFNPNSTCSTGSMTLTNGKQTKKITLTTSTARIHVE
jgi:prepilin-type N-terminal cleavage/methylation domain-containing protein